MPGFSNDTVYGANVNFTGSGGTAGREPTVTSDGQLLIGSTVAPNLKVGKITSTGGTIAVTNGAGTINLEAVSGGSGITTVNSQVFTSSGTYTPTAKMDYCIIEVIAGGGGGGGAANGAGFAVGGGGGAGGYARKVVSAATIGASQTVTIGTGGAGGIGNSMGTAGVNSSLGALLLASGGAGGWSITGAQGAIAAGGNGGLGLFGDINSYGGPGGWGMAMTMTGTNYHGIGGQGGSSAIGGGVVTVSITSGQSAGQTGFVYGGGGSGAIQITSGTTVNGGIGAPGAIIITEYISA